MAAEIVQFQPQQSLTPLYDAALRALEQARTSEECKGIVDRAAALEYYARLVKDKVAEAQLKELKMQAKRHLGKLLKDEKATGERQSSPGRPLKNNKKKTSEPPTISRQQAHEAEKLADMPKVDFDAKVQAVKEATLNPPPRRAAPMPTPDQKQWDAWLDKIPGAYLLNYYKCEFGISAAGDDDEIRKAAEERKQLQEQIRQLEEEKRQLEERVKAPAAKDIAAQFGAMTSSDRNGVMFRIVTDHMPADPRERQQWAKDACGWIQLIYSKLAGTRESPWKWRQKVHRLIKLPPGIDAGKQERDEIGDNPVTATEADLARQVAPPRPVQDLPKLDESPDYRRLAPPGSLLKSDKGRRNGKDHEGF